MMSPQAKWEYMKTIYERYHQVENRAGKGLILDEFCKTYKCHRKHALRLFNSPPPGLEKPRRSPRGSVYDKGRVLGILEAVWKASGYLCGQRLASALAIWLPATRNRFKTTREEERLLLAMSPATIDRKLKSKKTYLRKRIYGTTRPGALLKHHIPIKTDSWDVRQPGFTEIDLVAHCGDCAEGDFANTLDMTDILTAWVERRCILGKGQEAVKNALDDMRKKLPFDLLGIDSDNGSEFINNHLLKYCQTEPVLQFTRGRPYKKDDNAHIEQKNWTHVRKLMGYGRYDTRAVVAAINDLYRNELRWFQNFFQPSVRLVRKVRVGSRLRRKYDAPKTPFERVIESGAGNQARLAQLRVLRDKLDPFALSEGVERKLTRIWAMRSKAPKPLWLKRWRIEEYRSKLPYDPILKPELLPRVENYEKVLRREIALQTW
jgi:hypothetical protein